MRGKLYTEFSKAKASSIAELEKGEPVEKSEQNEAGKECFNQECPYNTSNGICIAFDGCAGAVLGDFRE